MITREILDGWQARIAKGYPLHRDDIAALVTLAFSHPTIAPELQPPTQETIGGLCLFPSCNCARACASYVRARG